MNKKDPRIFLIPAITVLLLPMLAQADEPEEGDTVTCAEMVEAIEIHLTTPDFANEELIRNKEMIVAHPKMAAPLVMQRLLFAENRYHVNRAANLLIDMDYDGEEIRIALKNVMSRAQTNLKGVLQADMLKAAARSLGRIGTPEDAQVLLPLLEHPEESVRDYAIDVLGKIAGADAVPKIERALEQHAQGMSAETLRQDLQSDRKEYSFLHEGFQAIAKIKYRTLLQDQIKEKSEE